MPKRSRTAKPIVKHARTVSNNHLYNAKDWREYSKQFRIDNPLCACGCGRQSQCVDHIIPYNYQGSFWDKRNHQALHNHCHSRKSGRESQGTYEDWIINNDGERIPARGEVEKL